MTDERKADDAASLHSRMMNVRPRKPPTEIQAEYESSTQAYAYACGHRDARHDCAEIALEADRALAAVRVPKVADDVTGLVERLRGGVYGINRIPMCAEAADALESLTARVAELGADAERYRWLRAQPVAGMHQVGWQIRKHWQESGGEMRGLKPPYIDSVCLNDDSLDAAVDAGIRQRAASER